MIIASLRPSFNSKLVRLKVHIDPISRRKMSSFNSKLVRLKEEAVERLRELAITSFNSKLVRLKVPPVATETTENLTVSIPNWFD